MALAPLDIDEIIRRVDAGESLTTIAADAGVTARTLRNRLHSTGIVLPQEQERLRRRQLLLDSRWLQDQYVNTALAPHAIAKNLGVSTAEVSAALERFRIEREPDGDDRLSRESLLAAFGEGGSVKSFARTVGVDRATVRRAMRKHGVTNPSPTRQRPPILDNPAWLRQRHETEGCSIASIAAELGSSERNVRAALVRHGIEIRRVRTGRGWRRLDPELARHQFVLCGVSIEQIADDAGVTTRPVRKVLCQQGVVIPRKQRRPVSVSRLSWPDGDDQFDVEWLHRRYVVQHRTIMAIASEACVSKSTVHTALHAHGLQRSRRRRGASALDDEQWLRLRYIDDGATAVDIAGEIGVSPKRIRTALARHHITRRR